MKILSVIFLLFFFTQIESTNNGMKIPSILLPFPTEYHDIEYVIEATNGCFSWQTSNNQYVKLQPIYEDNCSMKCRLIISQMPSNERKTFWIKAEDTIQKVNLRTEVVIDNINKIDIITTTRLMNKDDYEVLEVAGYDMNGNKFSTLEGIPIRWTISSVNGTRGESGNYVSIEKFHQIGNTLKLKASEVINDLERRDIYSSKILVKGLELGKAEMTANLMKNPSKESKVVLTVLQILHVVPDHDLYVLEKTQLNYEVFTTRRNEIVSKINMPNENYIWASENPNVCSVDTKGNVECKNVGKTVISVMYKETPESIQKRVIHVVRPAKLKLNWKEIGGVWQWVEGRKYKVVPELLDEHGNVIEFTKHTEFSINVESGLQIVSHTKGFTEMTILAKSLGKYTIKAVLEKCDGYKKGYFNTINTYQDVVISSQVVADQKTLLLAYPGSAGCVITAKGGSTGEYNFINEEGNSITVSNEGNVFPRKIGKNKIIVSDARNADNFDIVEVEAAEVVSMDIQESIVESPVGKKLNFTTTSKDSLNRIFNQCSTGVVHWKVTNNDIFELITNETNSHAEVLAKISGSSTLTATSGKGIAEVQIFAFDEIRTTYNSLSKPRIAKGASFVISFEGGPLPWHLNKNLYYTRLSKNENYSAKILDNNKVLVSCKEYGDSTLAITIGNAIGKTHGYEINSTAKVEFTCSKPSVLILTNAENYEYNTLSSEIKIKQIPSICKERAVNNIGGVKNEMIVGVAEEIDLVAYVKASSTEIFTNSSTVQYVWSYSNKEFIKSTRIVDASDHSTLHVLIGEDVGKVEIKIAAIRYKKEDLSMLGIGGKHIEIDQTLVKSITLNIVDRVQTEPSSITMFNHPDNYVIVRAKYGSGFYNFSTPYVGKLGIEQQMYQSTCRVTPVGEISTYILVTDICFNPSTTDIKIPVTVSNVHDIKIRFTDQIEVGKKEILTFDAIDMDGNKFDESQYKFMNILVKTDNPHIQIEKKSEREYYIHANSVGTSSITVIINEVYSSPHGVVVYDHFKCQPNQINLIPLSEEVIKCSGGPPFRSMIMHQIKSGEDKIELNGDKVKGKYKGKAQIVSIIKYIDLLSGEKRENGREVCDIVVKHLTGLRMEAHQTTLEVGGQTKIKVIGEAEGIPINIASTQLDFTWKQSDELTTELKSVYYKSNLNVNEEMSHTILVTGKKQGQTRIHVQISNIQKGLPESYKTLTASILINVIEPFSSLCAGRCRNVIDMSVHSRTQIVTNRESFDVKFEVLEGSDIISVDGYGQIESKGTPGSALVRVQEISTKEKLSYVVKVHRIHAIELLPKEKTTGVSAGESLDFQIVQIGDNGIVLTENYDKFIQFDLIPNGYINVKPSDNLGIITVTGVKPGRVILKVKSSDGSRLEDEVRVTVHHSVTPINAIVPVGSEIKFRSVEQAKWTTENKGIISISSDGRAIARHIGKTVVQTIASTPAQTKITVSPLQRVELESELVGSGKVLIPVTIYTESGLMTYHTDIDPRLIMKCSVDESTWAESVVEISNGKIYCAVTAIQTQSTSKPPEKINLRFGAKDGLGNLVQSSVLLPFRAGIIAIPSELKLKIGSDKKLEIYRAKGDLIIRDLTGKLQINEVSRGDGTASFNIRGMEHSEGFIEIYDGIESLKVKVTVSDTIKEKGNHYRMHDDSSNTYQPNTFFTLLVFVVIVLAILYFIHKIISNCIGNENVNQNYNGYNRMNQQSGNTHRFY